MSTNKTSHFGLNQWEPGDQVRREEFNADNQKIDAALEELPRVVAGSYVGDGQATRFIPLGFTPRALYLCTSFGQTYNSTNGSTSCAGGLALPGVPVAVGERKCLEIVEGGFQTILYRESSSTYRTNHGANAENTTYCYLALK